MTTVKCSASGCKNTDQGGKNLLPVQRLRALVVLRSRYRGEAVRVQEGICASVGCSRRSRCGEREIEEVHAMPAAAINCEAALHREAVVTSRKLRFRAALVPVHVPGHHADADHLGRPAQPVAGPQRHGDAGSVSSAPSSAFRVDGQDHGSHVDLQETCSVPIGRSLRTMIEVAHKLRTEGGQPPPPAKRVQLTGCRRGAIRRDQTTLDQSGGSP